MKISEGFAVIAIALFIISAFILGLYTGTTIAHPQCAEDVVIVGGGQYSNGRWEFYSCGPALGDLIVSKN
jgi:hypothetical protein